jgi:hypothetical protein
MTTLERVQEAVSSADDIRWLRGYLQGYLDSGRSAATLAKALKRAAVKLREVGDEETADLVLDGLDLLAGWCGPGMGLRVPERA